VEGKMYVVIVYTRRGWQYLGRSRLVRDDVKAVRFRTRREATDSVKRRLPFTIGWEIQKAADA
jgi:hypothetical protein